MHSSRMRTTRLLPVSPSMHCPGGGVPALVGVSAQGDEPVQVPPPLWTDRHV